MWSQIKRLDRRFLLTMAMLAATAVLVNVTLYVLIIRPELRATWAARGLALLLTALAYFGYRQVRACLGVNSFAEFVSYGVDLFTGKR